MAGVANSVSPIRETLMNRNERPLADIQVEEKHFRIEYAVSLVWDAGHALLERRRHLLTQIGLVGMLPQAGVRPLEFVDLLLVTVSIAVCRALLATQLRRIRDNMRQNVLLERIGR